VGFKPCTTIEEGVKKFDDSVSEFANRDQGSMAAKTISA